MALRDLFRRPAAAFATARPDRNAVPLGDQVGVYGGLDQATAIGGGSITAKREAYLTPMLTDRKLTPQLVKEMRTHYQVNACLLVQSLPLLGAEWQIESDDDDVRELVTAAVQPIMTELMRSAARAMWAGYSPNTIVWDLDPETGAIAPRKIRDLEPSTCKPMVDEAGNYMGFVQHEGRANEQKLYGEIDGTDARLLTLWVVEGMEAGNLYGRSLLTAARDPWQRQQAFSLFHERYLERFGDPVVITRAPDGMVQDNVLEQQQATAAGLPVPAATYSRPLDVAREIGEQVRNGATVALPSAQQLNGDGKSVGYAWELEYLEASRSGAADYQAAITAQDKAIARAIFVPDLILGDGGGIGSYALSKEHRGIWEMGVENRLADYAAQITRHLIDRVVEFNFGQSAPRAELAFAPLGDQNTEHLWEMITSAVNTGRFPEADLVEVAERVGVPMREVTDAERAAVEAAGEEPPTPAPAEEALRGAHTHGVDLAAPPADVTNVPDWQQPQSFDPQPWRREPNARERGVQFRAIEDGLNAAERSAIEALVALLESSREKVGRQIDGIIRKNLSVAETIAALNTVTVVQSTGTYAAAWETLMRDVWGLALGTLSSELGTFGELVPENIGPAGRAMVSAYAGASAERTVSDLTTRVRLALIDTYTSDVTTRAGLTAAVGDLYDRTIRSEGQGPRLTTRMLASRALNQGRADGIERGGIPLRGAQYSALMDRRTCELCERQDEQVIAIGDLDLQKFTPPVHHNCRCVLVYITTEEEDFTPTWTSPPRSMVERFGSLIVQ